MSSLFNSTRAPMIGLTALSFLLTASAASVAADIPVDPETVEQSLYVDTSTIVNKTVQTPEFPPEPDIVFLSDTTASMGSAIASVQSGATTIMTAVVTSQPTAEFGAAQYRDTGDTPLFQVDASLTANTGTVSTAIGTWSAGGGGDTPECQLNALNQLANEAAGAWREDGTPIIVWFGDASGHDPCNGVSEAAATAALVANEVLVVAIPVSGADGLDSTGQATRITAATGGFLGDTTDPDGVADAILDGLSNLPVTVVPTPIGCDPLSVNFNPTQDTVTSGDPVSFVETITVPNQPALAGTLIHCEVEFQDDSGNLLVVDDQDADQEIWIDIPIAINLDPDTDTNELGFDLDHTVTATVTSGPVPIPDRTVSYTVTGQNAGEPGVAVNPTDANGQGTFTYGPPVEPDSLGTDNIEGCLDVPNTDVCDTVEKTWEDTTPPTAMCIETVNPHGQKKPQAPGTGQNEDGFYVVSASDVVWPEESLEIFISGFGPFSSGDNVKITEDEYATPESKKMGSGKGKANAIVAHLILNADPLVTAFDGSGNESDPVDCLVPPAPK